MYGDYTSAFSSENSLFFFDRNRDIGSLARALPGLSLTSVQQWPTARVKEPRARPSFRCHRDQSRTAAPAAPASPPPTPPQFASSPIGARVSLPNVPAPRADPSSAWVHPVAAPSEAEAWPSAHAEQQHTAAVSSLEWPDWNRWARSSVSSVDTVGFTAAPTAPEFALETTDDESTLLSRSPSPRLQKIAQKADPTPELRPPRPCLQPAKTGFALWVGNLSPHTTLMDLRELFGTPEIQSIYLIQRTGCAFVNYSSGAALDAAIALFHRRNGRLHEHELVIKAQRIDDDQQQAQAVPLPVHSPDRFFICKSLTVEDLEKAKRSGQWSTQLRNRDKFNEAFEQAENVYLVFSANRTSAFYGFARMETPFGDCLCGGNHDVDAACSPVDAGFEVTRTPPIFNPEGGLHVPAGEIVLDSLRSSQFWKVDGCPYAESDTEKWAAPARITWLSPRNEVVPFSRTRQLKNSLNQSKPVKVARDGTEVDPIVGRELCEMFHMC